MNEIISNDFLITSILLKNSAGMLQRLLKQFDDKQVLLLKESFDNYPCETVIINHKTDLLKLVKSTINEFDLLIIDDINVDVKSKNLINFIKAIYKMEEMKDKQIILLFNYKKTKTKDLGIDSFDCFKKAVSIYSDRIYTISADNHHYFIKELKTCQTKVFRHF